LDWLQGREAKRIKESFNGLIHDIRAMQASRILSKLASSMKLSSKDDHVLINVIQVKDEVD
jgi:hypothetical protein